MQKQTFDIGNVHCTSCEGKVLKLLGALEGVDEVQVNVLRKKMFVSFDASLVGVADIEKAMQNAGYTATPIASSSLATLEKMSDISAVQKDVSPTSSDTPAPVVSQKTSQNEVSPSFATSPLSDTATPFRMAPPMFSSEMQKLSAAQEMSSVKNAPASFKEQAFLLHKVHCSSCQGKIHAALMALDGIVSAEVNTLRRSVVVKYDMMVTSPVAILEAFADTKYKLQGVSKQELPPLIPAIQDVKQKKLSPNVEPTPEDTLKEQAFLLHKVHCSSCQGKIHAALMAIDGIISAEVNTLRRSVVVTYDTEKTSPAVLLEAFADSKYKLQEVNKKELPPLIPAIQDVKQKKLSFTAQSLEPMPNSTPQVTVEEEEDTPSPPSYTSSVAEKISEQDFKIGNVHCTSCEDRVQKLLMALGCVHSVQVNLLRKTMHVRFDSTGIDARGIAAAMEGAGYSAAPMLPTLREPAKKETSASDAVQGQTQQNISRNVEASAVQTPQEKFPWVLSVSLFFAFLLMYVAMADMFALPLPVALQAHSSPLTWAGVQALLCFPILLLNKRIFISGFRALCQASPNMDSLVGLGSAAATAFGAYALWQISAAQSAQDTETVQHFVNNLYFDSAGMILALIGLGKYFETKARDRAGSAIDALMRLTPPTTLCLRNGEEISIPTASIREGDILVVYAGQSLAADGVITQGSAFIDTSVVTGESLPQEKNVGDTVIGATISLSGYFQMRVTKAGNESTLARIIDLVESATASKAPIARLADRISAIFVPVIIVIALVTFGTWLLLGEELEFALSVAISVLVISCPCALGLATPTAIMVGMGMGAERGILYKSAAAIERLQAIDTVILDKTGTLTHGKPTVTDIYPTEGYSEDQLLLFAANIEKLSEHPLGQSIVQEAERREFTLLPAESFTRFVQMPGLGLMAEDAAEQANRFLAGNARLLAKEDISNPLSEKERDLARQGKTVLYFAHNQELIGLIGVADTIKKTSKTAVQSLKALGLNVLMITGDNAHTAKAVQHLVDIETIVAEVLPQEKEEQVRKLEDSGHKVAMVGDGINDAPALARAHVGIAIGAGTDIALQSADIVLMQSDVTQVADALRLSKAVMGTIRQNLFWAFAYNVVLIPVAAGLFSSFGVLLSPMLAAASMSLSSLTVVGNALRLRLQKKRLFDALSR